MQAENSSLRTQVAELRKQLQDVLDHTIESDRRLLQFTDELFVVNPSRNETPSTSSSVGDTIPIEPGEQRSTECKNRQCTEVRDLVNSLKTTIEVLEAEIEQLKSGSSSCPCKEPRSLLGWTGPVPRHRGDECAWGVQAWGRTVGCGWGGQPHLPGNCYVLIAGANDVGAGESSTIFEHLEQQIILRTSTAKVVVSTVPYRHDLSTDHPVNKQTTLVNHYIRDLCARCEGSVLLDFNTIGRRHFTHHGQHLTMGGKRLLARLVVANLRRASLVSVGPSQPPPLLPLPSPAAPAESPSIAAAEPQSPPTLSPGSTADTAVLCVPPGPTTPWTLPHDSYAEAVRSSPPNERRTSDENTKSKAVFLGTPLGNSG
ncbi:hypothetical protein J6590_070200 [Homalodisca vitripennis]|nr:hypothetical protein J6590_070200 [Homalodisca vitripennis]